MTDINLIPAEFRRRVALRQYISRFALTCMLALGGIAIARSGLGYLIWRDQADVVRIEAQQQRLQQGQTQVLAISQQRDVTEQQLATLDQLRGRDRVALFLRAVDSAYNGRIWLDSVHFVREHEADASLEFVQVAELHGHANTYSELAMFMQSLGTQPVVADVRLINTTRTFSGSQVIDFSLALRMQPGAHP
jgi:Tfp pilus assembly protein PilN